MRVLFGYLTTAFRGGVKYQYDSISRMPGGAQGCGFLTSAAEVPYEKLFTDLGGRVHHLPPTRQMHARTQALRALRGDYDLIYLNKASANLPELLCCRAAGFPVIVHAHSTTKEARGPIRLVFLAMHYATRPWLPLLCSGSAACSEAAARFMFGRHQVKAGHVTLLHNGVELDKFCYCAAVRHQVREAFGAEGPVVFHAGALTKVKNQSFLLLTFRELLRDCPDAQLWIAGDGPLRETLERMAAQLGILKQVRFLGQSDDVPKLLSGADLFLLPSLKEGLPFCCIEAQAAGLPVLASSRVSPETAVTPLMRFLPLSAGPSGWARTARQMLKQVSPRPEEPSAALRDAGYDLQESAAALARLLNTPLPQRRMRRGRPV